MICGEHKQKKERKEEKRIENTIAGDVTTGVIQQKVL